MHKVLVVDDRPTYVKDVLDRLDCDALFLSNIQSLLAELDRMKRKETSYCACIVDLVLGGQESGIEAIRVINEKTPDIPVILFSAFVDLDVATEGACRIAYFVQKGIDEEETLGAALKSVCETNERNRRPREVPALECSVMRRDTFSSEALHWAIVGPKSLERILDRAFEFFLQRHANLAEQIYVRFDLRLRVADVFGGKDESRARFSAEGLVSFGDSLDSIKCGSPCEGRFLKRGALFVPVREHRPGTKTSVMGVFIFLPKDGTVLRDEEKESIKGLCLSIAPWLCQFSPCRVQHWASRIFGQWRYDDVVQLAAFVPRVAAFGALLAALVLLVYVTRDALSVVYNAFDMITVSATRAGANAQQVAPVALEESVESTSYGEYRAVSHGRGESEESRGSDLVVYIKLVEGYLLAAVLFVSAVGLFGMVTEFSPSAPPWIRRFGDLDVAKEKIVGIIITIMAASYLDYVLARTKALSGSDSFSQGLAAGVEAIGVGLSIAIVVWVLVNYSRFLSEHHREP